MNIDANDAEDKSTQEQGEEGLDESPDETASLHGENFWTDKDDEETAGRLRRSGLSADVVTSTGEPTTRHDDSIRSSLQSCVGTTLDDTSNFGKKLRDDRDCSSRSGASWRMTRQRPFKTTFVTRVEDEIQTVQEISMDVLEGRQRGGSKLQVRRVTEIVRAAGCCRSRRGDQRREEKDSEGGILTLEDGEHDQNKKMTKTLDVR